MNDQWIGECWEKINEKLSVTSITSYNKIPYTTINGVHDNKMETEKNCWTNGFWPALMILMYSATKKEQYLHTARHSMDLLDEALFTYDGLHHDVGFMWNISSGMDYRLTGDENEKNRFLIAANYLMGRYNCIGEFFRAWDGKGREGYVIIDCMMNIPLLYRASETVGDNRFSAAAMKHADKTMKYHIRQDGSCRHINIYDANTGEFIKDIGGQGYADGSSWSRGQAWGLYGFSLSYRHTAKQEYLDTAKRIANYFISNVQMSDWRVLCDLRQPETPVIYDSTAGACAACGLLELANLVEDMDKRVYINAAKHILKVLYYDFCDWSSEEDSIIQKGTEAYGSGIHKPIIYGDYFFVEGIYRLMGFDTKILW